MLRGNSNFVNPNNQNIIQINMKTILALWALLCFSAWAEPSFVNVINLSGTNYYNEDDNVFWPVGVTKFYIIDINGGPIGSMYNTQPGHNYQMIISPGPNVAITEIPMTQAGITVGTMGLILGAALCSLLAGFMAVRGVWGSFLGGDKQTD